jgi:hemoglobin
VQNKFETHGKWPVSPMGISMILVALMAMVLMPARAGFAQGMTEPPKEKTLYQRMGGYDVIAAVVDDFIHQLGEDAAFKRFGGGRSHSSLVATRQLVIEDLCKLTGGPCAYIGRDLKTAHTGLAITQEEWDLSIQHFKKALDDQKVAEQEQKEFLAVIQSTRPDIVEKPKANYPAAGKSMKQN